MGRNLRGQCIDFVENHEEHSESMWGQSVAGFRWQSTCRGVGMQKTGLEEGRVGS